MAELGALAVELFVASWRAFGVIDMNMMVIVGSLLTAAYVPHCPRSSLPRPLSRPLSRAGLLTARLADDKAWSEFVLLRPTADECEIEEAFEGSSFEFHKSHVVGTSCDTERVPGTMRTIIICSVLCTLVAIPTLMANPAVLEKLLEWAATSVVKI